MASRKRMEMPATRQTANDVDHRDGRVQALTRALEILNVIAEHGEGMGLTELARATKLAPSTAHRLLTTLQQDRFVQFDSGAGLWLVGVQAFRVGSAFVHTRDIARIARPYLRRLTEATGETANLAIEDEGMAVYVGQVESRQFVRAIAKTGGRVFMHSSALGKAILAALPPADISKIILHRAMPLFTPKTIVEEAALLRQVEKIRRQGYAVDDEEYSIGLRCVSASVFDEHGSPIAAISLSGPTFRVTRNRVPELGATVLQVAQELTAELGGRRPKAA